MQNSKQANLYGVSLSLKLETNEIIWGKSLREGRPIGQTAPAAEEPLKNRLRAALEPFKNRLRAVFEPLKSRFRTA